MRESVKNEPAGRAERTERRIIDAATGLFRTQGYRGTALTQVASVAGVSPRTVYVRFGTKAVLLLRVLDVARVGDTAPVGVTGRDWFVTATSAPALHERLSAFAAGSRALMERLGPLLAVSDEAEPTEPAVAEAARAARSATVAAIRRIWEGLAEDGLLHPAVDLTWAITTAVPLSTPVTYLFLTQELGLSPAEYQTWLLRTWTQLATTPGPPRHADDHQGRDRDPADGDQRHVDQGPGGRGSGGTR